MCETGGSPIGAQISRASEDLHMRCLLTDVFGLLNFPQVQRKGESFAFSDRVSSSLKTVGKGALGMNWVR